MTMKATVFNGIDQIESVDALLKGKRLGLITNPTGTRKDPVSYTHLDVYKRQDLY